MADIDLSTKLAAITDYYGVGTIWDKMSISGLTVDQINAMYNSLPASSFQVDRTISGAVLGRNYTNPFELPVVPGSDFDSNIPGGQYSGGNTFSGNIPANLTVDPSTGLPVNQFGGSVNPAGLTVATVADRVSLAVTGVNLGAMFGMKIDSLLYNSDPEFWNTHLPSINPETWSSLCGQSEVGDFFLRTLFGIDGNSMSGYVNEEVVAYYYQMMRDGGFFDMDEKAIAPPGAYNPFAAPLILCSSNVFATISVGYYNFEAGIGNAEYIVVYKKPNGNVNFTAISRSPFTAYSTSIEKRTGNRSSTACPSRAYTSTYSGNVYYYVPINNWDVQYISNWGTLSASCNNATSNSVGDENLTVIVFDGTITASSVQPGVSTLDDSTLYPPTNITGTTTQQVLQQMKQEYPDLFTKTLKERTMQEDGTVDEITYVEIPWVTPGTEGEESTTEDERTQGDTDIDPITGEDVLPTSPTDEPVQPPDTGTGDAPVPVLPTGSASSLWAIYNPTQAELNSFGSWLWSSNFIEQLKKLFNDPMQAIIGVHKVFATPSTGSSQTIKCGYIDSGVSAKTVTSQYTTVDCGKATVREYFGNVFDYDPFTKISLFLPFIGIVPLNTADVMRGKVAVKYSVDVISGACLAEVTITRDGSGGIIYTYSGSAIVSYPLSSGSYMGVVQSAISTAIGIGVGLASGGASAGLMAGSVLSGVTSARTNVQHSGQFTGCSGAMGGKKPYLIITRPQTRTPSNVNKYLGLPSYAEGKLSEFSGFTKVKEVHVESESAYSGEIEEITALLKSGVII